MTRRARALLPLAVVAAVVAACRGNTDDPTTTATTEESELNVTDIRCRAEAEVGSSFDLSPVIGSGGRTLLEGVLIDEYGQITVFACSPAAARVDAGAERSVASCRSDGAPFTVELVRDEMLDLRAHIDLARLGPGEADPGFVLPCAAVRKDVAPPTYETVAPYVHRACGGCHADQFDSLDKIKAQRDLMLGLIAAGAMPRRDATWRYGDEGRAVIAFLAKGAELQ